jgi:hypothetical protein
MQHSTVSLLFGSLVAKQLGASGKGGLSRVSVHQFPRETLHFCDVQQELWISFLNMLEFRVSSEIGRSVGWSRRESRPFRKG